jgi:hypothetical protein
LETSTTSSKGTPGALVELEEQQIGQGRLCTFDLAGEHRLAPDVGVKKQVRVRQKSCHAVQPPAGEQTLLQQALACAGEI